MGLSYTYFENGGDILVLNKTKCKEYAQKLLICSLVRDRYEDTWNIAGKDSDLKDVISNEFLQEKLFKIKCLKIDDPFMFEKDIDEIPEILEILN